MNAIKLIIKKNMHGLLLLRQNKSSLTPFRVIWFEKKLCFMFFFLSALMLLMVARVNEVHAAAPTWQASSAIAASTGADVTVTLPAHAANDILLLQVVVRDTDDTITWPAGWVQIATVDRGATARYWWAWKRAATSAETNPLVSKSTTTGDSYAAVTSYRGAITTGDPWEVKGSPNTATTANHTLNGITTVTAESLIVAALCGEDNSSTSPTTFSATNPATLAQVLYVESNTGADGVCNTAASARTAIGATGNVTAAWQSTVVGSGGIVLALKPAPPPPPQVSSINRASFDPTTSNTVVTWAVTFDQSVTGVDAGDFALVQAGGASGASITGVSGSGTSWTVTANTGTGTSGTVQLKLVDNDTVIAGAIPLGGAGAGNGNFTGQSYTILAPVCTGAADIIFCDDFERSSPGAVGNGWTVTENAPANCTGTAGNARCAGIDSDIPPFNVSTNPRANPTRAMFTRWDRVTVASPTVNLAGKVGGQLSFWMRRGHDNFSECPEAAGENYLVEYYASDSTWKLLAQFPSSPSAALCDGAIFTPTIELPADALHANFKLRFYQPSGSGDSGSGGAAGVVGYDYWHMDNVIVREKASPSFVGSFCDNFEGSLGRWSITAEGAPSGAAIGDASLGTLTSQSPTHTLDMRWGYVVASTFKTDITGVSGNISYWLKSGTTTDRDPDSGEDLLVEYLNSSGNWVNLATYLGSAAAGAVYNGSFAIPSDAKHANFRLRFRHLNASGYDKDYWHLDDVCVGDLVASADLSISKVRTGSIVPGTNASYAINVTNNGPGTLSGSVVVSDTLPASLTYLSGSGSGWSCSANFQVVSCDWLGTLASGAVAPTLLLTVGVSSGATGTISNTATVSGTVVDNTPGNNSSTDTATIYIPSYVFTDKACATGVAIGAGVSPCNLVDWSAVTAGQPLAGIYVTALDTSGTPTQLSASGATAVNFQLGLSCVNPTSDAGVQATFSAVAGALPLCAANGAVPTVWSSSTTLSFAAGSPSLGPYSFNYNDVGKVELYIRNASATSQIGQSGTFVVKPAGFVLSGIKCTSANAANCGAGALAMATSGDNPAAPNAAGVSFIRAGLPFSVTVTAVNSGGNATPNYGRETAPESVKLTPINAVAGMVSPPAIGGTFAAFASGVATGTAFSWGEVGIITLLPSVGDGDYLGGGNVTGTSSGNVGRFYPDHFDTVVTQVANVPMACPSGVTCPAAYPGIVYSGQTFSLAVTAKNASGGTTANYNTTTGFSKTTTLAAFGVLGVATAPTGAGTLGVVSETAFVAGALTEAAEKYIFTTAPTLPTNIYIRASDIETSSLRLINPATDSVEGGVTVVSGRIKISNSYGSELLPLSVVASAQYYGGSGWLSNVTDAVTQLTFPATFAVGAGSTAVTLSPVSGVLSGGVLTVKLGKPSNGSGIATIAPTVAGVPAYLPVTAGQATFGVYNPNNNFIYQRENY